MISITQQTAPTPLLNIALAKEQILELLDYSNIDQYIDDTTVGKVIRHPLISTMYDEARRDFFLHLIEQNVNTVLEKLDEGRASSALYLFANIYRLDALLALEPAMTNEDFWSSASHVWQRVEWPYQSAEQWREVFMSNRPMREAMMDEEERDALAAMPNTIKIYRGTVTSEKNPGMSWTVDRERAEWFARRNATFHPGRPKVLESTIAKTEVIAYLKGRGGRRNHCHRRDASPMNIKDLMKEGTHWQAVEAISQAAGTSRAHAIKCLNRFDGDILLAAGFAKYETKGINVRGRRPGVTAEQARTSWAEAQAHVFKTKHVYANGEISAAPEPEVATLSPSLLPTP